MLATYLQVQKRTPLAGSVVGQRNELAVPAYPPKVSAPTNSRSITSRAKTGMGSDLNFVDATSSCKVGLTGGSSLRGGAALEVGVGAPETGFALSAVLNGIRYIRLA